MREPKSIRAAQTTMSTEMQTIEAQAQAAQTDAALTDEQADSIISEYNRQVVAAGMPAGMTMASRAAYRAAWGTL
jgi:ketosteroid isomerase-like protein